MDAHHIARGLERRQEDYPLITGRAHYVDDLRPAPGRPPILYMAVVRSPYAHARVTALQRDEARAVKGVVAIYTGQELLQSLPPLQPFMMPGIQNVKLPGRQLLATEKVRYVGDPVAIVLAGNRYAAIDGRDLVSVDYEPLPVVSTPEEALEPDAPLLYEELGSNVAYHKVTQGGDIAATFAEAEHTLTLRLVNQRLAPASMEARACLFDFDATTNMLTAWVSSQAVYQARDTLSYFLGIAPDCISVYNAEVGGAFGAKTRFLGEEIIAALLAVKHAGPVKWTEERSENLQSHIHGRGQIAHVEASYTSTGRMLGLKVHILGDIGAFPYSIGPYLPTFTANLLSGPYHVQAIECQISAVFTNRVPTGPYRGAGRPEATYILERTIERIARELRLDPAEVRRRNLITADAFPYHTPTGLVYDSGNYQAALGKALAAADYDGWRARQRRQRRDKEQTLLGIGISTFIETTGGPMGRGPLQEAATVRILRDGTILVQSAVAHNGQGHFTTFAQIAAQVFDVPGTQITVRLNDTTLPGYSVGTNGSRTIQTAGSAIYLAAKAVREKALHLAAQILEVSVDDLIMTQGHVAVRGVPSSTITLGKLAALVEEQPTLIEREPPNPANGVQIEGLAAWRDFSPTSASIASGTHVAVVEVDQETGDIHLLRYVAVDDGGCIIHPDLVEAQMHGSLAQGIGQALFEEVAYDENGQNLTGTLLDYALPVAEQLPTFETYLVETASPLNPLGVKGVGEAGTIAAPPTIVNAVLDALTPFGITTIDMPLRPEKIWKLLQIAREGSIEHDNPYSDD